MNSDYEITKHQLTGDALWKINDIDLAITDGGISITKDFIDKNKYEDYTLSIYDELTKKTIEIDANINEMPIIISNIYRTEHATPMTFIGVNTLTKSYVVGMTLAKGHIDFGSYNYIDGKLNKID